MASRGTIKLGPWSGPGGFAWTYNPDGDTTITEIVINYGKVVDSIYFKSIDKATEEIIASGTFGGTGGDKTTISIDGPGEYLTSISGTITEYYDSRVIQSLTFYTNQRVIGPFGNTNGFPFEIPMRHGEIVGFFGRAGNYVDAIGIYVKPRAY